MKLGPTPQNTWDVTPAEVSLIRPVLLPRPAQIPAKPQNIVLDVARSGLVVVDMQNDFCTKGGWFSEKGADVSAPHRIVPALQELLPVFRAAGARPDIFLALNGPLGAPSKTIDISGLTGWLTLRAIDQQSQKLNAIEAAPGAQPEAKSEIKSETKSEVRPETKPEAAPAAAQPKEPPKKRPAAQPPRAASGPQQQPRPAPACSAPAEPSEV